jgi:uncharacterized protein YjbJ (UPF0337 family)
MRGSAQVAKGRIEEAAGALAGSDKLRAKGQVNQSIGAVRQAAEKGVRQAKASARKIVESARFVAKETVSSAKQRSSAKAV